MIWHLAQILNQGLEKYLLEKRTIATQKLIFKCSYLVYITYQVFII